MTNKLLTPLFVSRFLLVVIAVVFMLIGAVSAKKLYAAFAEKPLSLNSLQLFPTPKALPPVMLRTADGEAFVREKFLGHWSLVFFGFTSCPDFCPMELHKLGQLIKLAQAQGIHPQVIFVSVDPERDVPTQLARYVEFFHPQIIGLRGDNPAIANFARFFGAAYERTAIIDNKVMNFPAGVAMPDVAGNQYQVNHSTRIFLVDPQGRYVGSAATPESAEVLWDDLQKLL